MDLHGWEWFCTDNRTHLFSLRHGRRAPGPNGLSGRRVQPLLAEANSYLSVLLLVELAVERCRGLVIAAQAIPTCPNVSRYETDRLPLRPVAPPSRALKAVYLCPFVPGVQHLRLVGRRAERRRGHRPQGLPAAGLHPLSSNR